ncbi:hypothetical protein FJ567_03065 [Mesorhizobium sp. B2-4-16]|nr:hypothetical protein FJ567_03065 [Mesorhizobium sp. B2-4-16]TPL76729.1 hypothetical protein FJ956_02600 [Mesorhizobium sp. B2-4-3]
MRHPIPALRMRSVGSGRRFVEPSSRSSSLLKHDLFRKPVPTFRDHALAGPGSNANAAQSFYKTKNRNIIRKQPRSFR